MRINILFAVLTLIIVIIVILMADSLMSAIVIVALILNFLAISAYWKQIQHGYASMNAMGWGGVPEDTTNEDDAAKEEDATEEEDPAKVAAARRRNLPLGQSLIEENRIPAETTDEDQNPNLYGRAQEEYDGYISAYTDCWRKPKPAIFRSCAELDNSIDSANVMMAQKRARDKRCMDGAVSKDVYFHRHVYAEELDESENKIWWGKSDY